MNEIYLYTTSAKSFKHSLAALLGLDHDTSIDMILAVIKRMKTLIPKGKLKNTPDEKENTIEDINYVVTKRLH